MSEAWVDVQLWRYVLDPTEGWDAGKWDEASWDAGYPEATAGWTSIICDVRGIDVRRGRQSVSLMGGTEAGVLLLELDNRDGQWSAFVEVAPGVFEPALSAGVQLRVVAGNDEVPFVCLFRGWVEGWVQTWTKTDDTVAVTAVDGWADLVQQGSAIPWTPGPHGEDVRQRLWRLLRMRAGWDDEQYPIRLQQGSTSLIGSSMYGTLERGLTLTNTTVADEILRTAQSDGGTCFLDGDGSFVYLNRSRFSAVGSVPAYDQGKPSRPAQPSPIPLFGDYCGTPETGELPYTDLEWEYRGTAPANVVVVANSAPPAVRDDAGNAIPPPWSAVGHTSIDSRYEARHRQALTVGSLRFVTEAEATALADFYLAVYADKYIAVKRLEVYPKLDDRLWSTVLGLRLGDHLRVLRRTQTNTLDLECILEGLRVQITARSEPDGAGHHYGDWLVSYTTSDAVTMLSRDGVHAKTFPRTTEEVAA